MKKANGIWFQIISSRFETLCRDQIKSEHIVIKRMVVFILDYVFAELPQPILDRLVEAIREIVRKEGGKEKGND